MSEKKSFITFVVIISAVLFFSLSINIRAQEEEPAGDEQDTFLSVAPDALIVMDISGSMAWNPAGGDEEYGSSLSCVADSSTGHCTGSGCSGGFCASSKSGCNINCSRLAIAKRALFSVLDDDNNNIINAQDAKSLNIRIGYMRFYNCNSDDTAGNYSSGCNSLVTTISTLGSDTGTSYQKTYCGNSTSCASTVTNCSTGSCIVGGSASGGTPLTSSLKEAKSYLDVHKASDKAKTCRQKFVILVSDGADTYTCSGDGGECQDNMYKRRRATVAAAKQLRDAGYKVFVVGFGSTMPVYLRNNLQWMAYYGGTDNPTVENTGATSAYNIDTSGCDPYADPPVTASCCKIPANQATCFPSGITSCQTDTANETASCYSAGVWSDTAHFKATNNDPGYLDLSGYAFLAGNADELTAALKTALNIIRDATYSFTSAAIQAVRTVDENYIYEASFQPATYEPFWIGHLKRYSINDDGTIQATEDWDAGEILAAQSSRNIWTYTSGALKAFVSGNLTPANLGVTTDAQKDLVINYFRTGETNTTVTNWKLGDIFHTSPMSITSPNFMFIDKADKSEPKAFEEFRLANERSSANGKRIILVGANAGQLHALRTGEAGAGGGHELWSFIPPNLLPKLQTIYHTTHPTALEHQYFVDGPLSGADIWLRGGWSGGTATAIDNTFKDVAEWRTLMVMSEGRGGNSTLWSSHSSCDENFSATYSTTYAHYCGYYAFDVTDTVSTPVYKWRLGANAALSETDGKHLGLAWSKMFIGRVRVNNTEKWIGLIGGGYSGTDCSGGGSCDTRGKGFYVVDLSTGAILWRYTHSGPSGVVNGNMDYNLVAGTIALDYDSDGFVDTAYVGDLGGSMWRFKFCKESDGINCDTANWTGGLLFQTASGNIMPIHTSVAVTTDNSSNLWVYFATGDKNDPTATNILTLNKFYAVKDSDRTSTYTLSNLENNSTGVYVDSSTKHGWYFSFPQGEKVLSSPVVYNGRVYFTSYVPASAADPCEKGGTAKLWVVDYITGAGMFAGGARYKDIGSGIPTAPVISRNPHTGKIDVYVSTSDITGGPHVQKTPAPDDPGDLKGNLIYWHDLRIQP